MSVSCVKRQTGLFHKEGTWCLEIALLRETLL